MEIEVVRGAAAHALLTDDAFIKQWTGLLDSCPWATAFQGPGFVSGWYGKYREKFEPVLVLGRDGNGGLCGLLPLVLSTMHGLTVVGMSHSEYDVWIAAAEDGETFILSALPRIRRLLPRSPLKFLFLPPGAPTGWIDSAEGSRYCLIEAHPRPLLRFGDGTTIAESLRKSSNKSKIKRLEKLGKLEFRRIVDPTEFDEVFARIVPGFNLRHGAVHGITPFLNDDLKMTFHNDMARVPGLLHVTAMMVGDTIASFHLGISSGKELQLGIIYYDARLAKHSPAKIHMLFLSRMLLEERFEQFDLTPGGDTYKERFASTWDQVHALTLFACRYDRVKWVAVKRLREMAKAVLELLRIDPRSARRIKDRLSRSSLRHTFGMVRDWAVSRYRTQIYSIEVATARRSAPSPQVQCDNIEALLLYEPESNGLSRQEFFSMAIRRFEDEQHVYTVVEDERLAHFGWLTERPMTEVCVAERLPGYTLSSNKALLLDVYMHPAAWKSRSTSVGLVSTILHHASGINGIERIIMPIPHGCIIARNVVEELGWKYEGSVYESCAFGRRKRWGDFALAGPIE